MTQYVLIGQLGPDVRAFGPFDSADSAREECNALGMPGIEWEVVPLISSAEIIR